MKFKAHSSRILHKFSRYHIQVHLCEHARKLLEVFNESDTNHTKLMQNRSGYIWALKR